jgi:hypothetical protein
MRTFTVKRLAVQTTRYTELDIVLCAYLADRADLGGEISARIGIASTVMGLRTTAE